MPDQRLQTTTPARLAEEVEFDRTLRPNTFKEFVGQSKVVRSLRLYIEAAKARGEPLDHVLILGPPGLGKTTLAHIIAAELGVAISVSSGPLLQRPLDLAGILTKLQNRQVLFIDEVHRPNPAVEEYLYSAMEEYRIDIMLDRGPNARSVQLNLEGFTLIGATTRVGLLTSPLRARFGVVARLDYYTPEELAKIIRRSARILGVKIDSAGALEIARRARGTPRIANRLLRRTRDYAEVEADGVISKEVAERSLDLLEVDELGLDAMDKRILSALVEKFSGGPVGINSLSVAVGEESETIEEVYEPYLIKEGFLVRTARGRQATELACRHFGLKATPEMQAKLFEQAKWR